MPCVALAQVRLPVREWEVAGRTHKRRRCVRAAAAKDTDHPPSKALSGSHYNCMCSNAPHQCCLHPPKKHYPCSTHDHGVIDAGSHHKNRLTIRSLTAVQAVWVRGKETHGREMCGNFNEKPRAISSCSHLSYRVSYFRLCRLLLHFVNAFVSCGILPHAILTRFILSHVFALGMQGRVWMLLRCPCLPSLA